MKQYLKVNSNTSFIVSKITKYIYPLKTFLISDCAFYNWHIMFCCSYWLLCIQYCWPYSLLFIKTIILLEEKVWIMLKIHTRHARQMFFSRTYLLDYLEITRKDDTRNGKNIIYFSIYYLLFYILYYRHRFSSISLYWFHVSNISSYN